MGNIVYITLLNVHTHNNEIFVVLIQLPSHVQFFVTPWIAACQASLSPAVSRSLPKFMSIESVILSNHLIKHLTVFIHGTTKAILTRSFALRCGAANSTIIEGF